MPIRNQRMERIRQIPLYRPAEMCVSTRDAPRRQPIVLQPGDTINLNLAGATYTGSRGARWGR
jgi:hypothetical protein